MHKSQRPDGISLNQWCEKHNCSKLLSVGEREQWYCRSCKAENTARWRSTPEGQAKSETYNEAHREDRRQLSNEWYYANKAHALTQEKQRVDKRREKIFAAYGNQCFCCGEITPEFLTIDHINGGGHRHRHSGRTAEHHSRNIYCEIVREGYPKDKYRLACWNCNAALGRYGYCPHQMRPSATA